MNKNNHQLILGLFVGALILVSSIAISQDTPLWSAYDESQELAQMQGHESIRMRFKLINSKHTDKNSLWKPFEDQLSRLTEPRIKQLKSLILEKDIPSIQLAITNHELSYEELTLFYLHRIRRFESDNSMSLNALISINPQVLSQARQRDRQSGSPAGQHPIYGMPILLKDNIGAQGMPTTAGAVALRDNYTADAFITAQLKNKGALILGKANLSEWAYFFCGACPLGYSAMGGQTLNPYGRMIFETGGSSSGSAVAVAANLAVAAVGSETSGSILSPASSNSTVGLKPTTGLLSRSGIVPISSTLDTAGPIVKNVIDGAIMLSAMAGRDSADGATSNAPENVDYLALLQTQAATLLQGKRLGALKSMMSNTLYLSALEVLRQRGAEIIEIDPPALKVEGFGNLLSSDMKRDLPHYLQSYGADQITVRRVSDVVAFNQLNSDLRIPYGQSQFEEIAANPTTDEQLREMIPGFREQGRRYFDSQLDQFNLDAILSVNNSHARTAAMANYPAFTVPMGFTESGKPAGLTFIARSFEEQKLLRLAYGYEQASKARRMPRNYQ